jgi:hypothetical protein
MECANHVGDDISHEKVLLVEAMNRTLPLARNLLYITHLFARFSDASWQFCLVIFLAAFTHYESIILVSTFGFMSGLTVFLLGSCTGRFIDYSNRLFIAQRFILMQHTFVILACICCYLLLTKNYEDDINGHLISNKNSTLEVNTVGKTSKPNFSWLRPRLGAVPFDLSSILLLIGIHIIGSGAEVFSRGFLISLERDWILVMAQVAASNHTHKNQGNVTLASDYAKSEAQNWLSETNLTMKQIDLVAQIGSPTIAGFFLNSMSNHTPSVGSSSSQSPPHRIELGIVALTIGILNILSLIVEYTSTTYIYRLIPELAHKEQVDSAVDVISSENKTNDPIKIQINDKIDEELTSRSGFFTALGCFIPRGYQIYMKQPIAWIGIGFALLYLNVLCFGSIMTSYLIWRGADCRCLY